MADSPRQSPPSPLITRRNRTMSMCERISQSAQFQGTVRWFCRDKGHGFIIPHDGGDDLFVHISDIDGEFVPHEGDVVKYRRCQLPPKMEKFQAVHVIIKDLAPGTKHERWDQPSSPHAHPHPSPNIHMEGTIPHPVHTAPQ